MRRIERFQRRRFLLGAWLYGGFLPQDVYADFVGIDVQTRVLIRARCLGIAARLKGKDLDAIPLLRLPSLCIVPLFHSDKFFYLQVIQLGKGAFWSLLLVFIDFFAG